MTEVAAIYEGGVFRPLDPVELPDHQRVQLRFEPIETRDMTTWLERVRARRERIEAERGNLLDSAPIIAADRMRDE